MNSYILEPQDDGFIVIQNDEKLMGAFGTLPMWFESETAARNYMETPDSQPDNMQAALQTLITQLRYKTGDPLQLNAEGIKNAMNADAVFYPYPGPESVEQHMYFEPLRDFLEKQEFKWRDLDLTDPFDEVETTPILKIVQRLSLADQARLIYLMINTHNLFIASLCYIANYISMHTFTEIWLFNEGSSVNRKSKAYQSKASMLERLSLVI